ncbi:MAG: diaminopimelate epimerase [Desulfomonile tiedjei]|uniref:Diaminopimelate epimerase n=1 Tax=Desulfomonile tiedjei TaxID=2358 RepID=A0A9D6Z1R5_9BACT|nr:diaminopimelate epimerase [Desulfomonile tiedjei]
MEINFKKMHGTLNDFVVFHDLENRILLSVEQVAHMCDRRAGIGADGVIVVRPSLIADFFMDYINADGSLAEMCGNGIRCLAKYAYDCGLTAKKTLPVETRAGVKTLELISGSNGSIERVRVNMAAPILEPEKIPANVLSDHPIIDYPLESGGRIFLGTLVSMGNPHCVIFVDEDPDLLPAHYGPAIETHEIFPAKTNVEFIRVLDRKRIVMRVWERGSGETFSCGTGACAAAVAANLKGLADPSCVVQLLGGSLDIEWKGTSFPVIMTGSAVTVFEGSITI